MNAKLSRAKAEHDAWLWRNGVHPEQLKNRKRTVQKKQYKAVPYTEDLPTLSNKIGNGFKTGIMAVMHKESPEVQKMILDKAKRVAPAYNKGGLQYISDNCDLTTLGRKV